MKTRPPAVKVDWPFVTAILIAHWRQLLKLPIGPLDKLQTREFHSVVEQVLRLQESHDFTETELFGAYLLYEWPIHLAQGISLIQELPELPNRVLDLASGAAPFALAAAMHGAKDVYAIDRNPVVLKYAGLLCGKIGYPLSVREKNVKDRKSLPEGKWDLIIIGHSLFELYSTPEDQKKYIISLCGKLSDQGYLLLVDSSEPVINKKLLMLRDSLVREGVKVQAPCIWQGACPALAHGSPCYTQRPFEKPPLVADIQRSGKIHSNSLKMSYFILRNLEQTLSHPDERLYRVVSPPIDTFRGKRHFLCGVDGKKMLGTRLTEHPKQSRAYEFLKKGDVVSIKNAQELGDDLQITEETEFLLKAPFDKPVQ